VNFNRRYGLKLDVLEIDLEHTLGALELERQRTLDRLLRENPKTIHLIDGFYRTLNGSLPLPLVIQNIALITAPDSDGQRDFKNEITKNEQGYSFFIKEFLTTIQGDSAHKLILHQLELIEKNGGNYDAVVIVRGGGSQMDFKPFDEYELAKRIASFSIPVLTGIGHDRNTSIVDLMSRQYKTPTKVATFIIDQNLSFENSILNLKERLTDTVADLLDSAKQELREMKRLVKSLSPSSVLNRGFAIITVNDKIITDPKGIKLKAQIQTLLKNEIIYSTVNKKSKNEKRLDI
jgi:exodeoxyribonuclease VII large subunit